MLILCKEANSRFKNNFALKFQISKISHNFSLKINTNFVIFTTFYSDLNIKILIINLSLYPMKGVIFRVGSIKVMSGGI